MREKWKTIDGYSSQYLISNFGRIKSLKTNKIRCPELHSDGYLKVKLWKANKPKNFLIHKLVAKYFIENNTPYLQVSHIDGDKTNNISTNLEWISQKDVVKRAWKLGKANIHSSNVKVYQYSVDYRLIKIYQSVVDAAQAVQRSTRSITRALDGHFHTSAGFIWRYELYKEGDLF